jgi:hypothetical protein
LATYVSLEFLYLAIQMRDGGNCFFESARCEGNRIAGCEGCGRVADG